MRTLVIGGAGSGKSEFAEKLCGEFGGALSYIATMHPEGDEAQDRIRHHRNLRAGKGFQTFECPRCQTFPELPENTTVLLECMGTLVANELFTSGDAVEGVRDHLDVLNRIHQSLRSLEQSSENIVVVSNDVFSDGEVYSEETQNYLRVLAEVNRDVAKRYECVVEVVCSIPLWHKGGRV